MMEALKSNKCLNCGEELTGNYCQKCGQFAEINRYSLKILFYELLDIIIFLDNQFFKTFKSLITKPGSFIRSYLSGKRTGYLSPLRYFFIVLTLNIAVSFLINKPAINPVKMDLDNINPVTTQLINLLINGVLLLIMIPFSFGMKAASKEFNTAENLVFLVYTHSQSILFMIVLQITLFAIDYTLPSTTEGITWFLSFSILYIWGYITFYETALKKKLAGLAGSYFTSILIFVGLIVIIRLILQYVFGLNM